MIKAIATLALILCLSSPALARPVIAGSVDLSPPSDSCRFLDPSLLPSRCYIPQYGPAPDVASPFVQADGGLFPAIVITLSQPTRVKITFRQTVFLDSLNPYTFFGRPSTGNAQCHPGLPSCSVYMISVGINGTTPDHVCGPVNDGAVATLVCFGEIGGKGYDTPFASGVQLEALFVVVLPAGTNTIYPVEAARDGATPFKGPGEGFLMVEYDDGT